MGLGYDSGLFLIEKNYSPTHQFLFILFILFQSISLGRKYIPYIQLRFFFFKFCLLLFRLGFFLSLFILRQ